MSKSKLLLLHSGSASLGFSPSSVAGMQLWMDASDANSFSLTGSDINSWTDKSSNAMVLTPVDADKPVRELDGGFNGKYTVGFDGGDVLQATGIPCNRWYNNDTTPETTMFAVLHIKASLDPALQYLFYHVNTGFDRLAFFISQGSGSLRVDFAGRLTLATSLISGAQVILTAKKIGTTIELFVNGVSVGSGTQNNAVTSTTQTFYLGGQGSSLGFDGNLGELLVYEGALSTSDQEAVEEYLAAKWFDTVILT